jgi:hypothetical protein
MLRSHSMTSPCLPCAPIRRSVTFKTTKMLSDRSLTPGSAPGYVSRVWKVKKEVPV